MEKLIRDGFLVLECLFTEEEVEEIREAGKQLAKNIPNEDDQNRANTLESQFRTSKHFIENGDKILYFFGDEAIDDTGEQKVSPERALNKVGHTLHTLDPVFQKFTYCERVREICWRLGMKDPHILQSTFTYNTPASSNDVLPHQDGTFLYTQPEDRVLGFWIALDDTTIGNGCLRFAVGSHKSGTHRRLIRNPDTKSNELLIFTSPLPTYPASSFKPVPVSKGSCILIHGQVVHKSDITNSDNPRYVYAFHVADLDNATYASDNWIQPPLERSFPRLYEKPPPIN